MRAPGASSSAPLRGQHDRVGRPAPNRGGPPRPPAARMPRARPAERSVFQADPFGRDHIPFSSSPHVPLLLKGQDDVHRVWGKSEGKSGPRACSRNFLDRESHDVEQGRLRESRVSHRQADRRVNDPPGRGAGPDDLEPRRRPLILARKFGRAGLPAGRTLLGPDLDQDLPRGGQRPVIH